MKPLLPRALLRPGARRLFSAGAPRGLAAEEPQRKAGPQEQGTSAPELDQLRLFGLLAGPGGSDRSPAGHLPPRGNSEYKLDLGKIADVLVRDYQGFFEHEPALDIYNEDIVFRVGRPFSDVAAIRGRRAYCRALSAFRGVTRTTVREGEVACSIADGTHYGHALRVDWRFQGDMRLLMCPVYIQAISLYSIAPRVVAADAVMPGGAACEVADQGARAEKPAGEPAGNGAPLLSHGVHRHTVEFVEIHPPSLRSLLQKALWEPKVCVAPLCFEQDGPT